MIRKFEGKLLGVRGEPWNGETGCEPLTFALIAPHTFGDVGVVEYTLLRSRPAVPGYGPQGCRVAVTAGYRAYRRPNSVPGLCAGWSTDKPRVLVAVVWDRDQSRALVIEEDTRPGDERAQLEALVNLVVQAEELALLPRSCVVRTTLVRASDWARRYHLTWGAVDIVGDIVVCGEGYELSLTPGSSPLPACRWRISGDVSLAMAFDQLVAEAERLCRDARLRWSNPGTAGIEQTQLPTAAVAS